MGGVQTSGPRQIHSEAGQGLSGPTASPATARGPSSTLSLSSLWVRPLEVHQSYRSRGPKTTCHLGTGSLVSCNYNLGRLLIIACLNVSEKVNLLYSTIENVVKELFQNLPKRKSKNRRKVPNHEEIV